LEAEIRLSYKSAKEAEAVAKAVAPDNRKVPVGLTVQTLRKGNSAVTNIACETKLQTFMATIDDLLESVSVAEDAFAAAGSRKVKMP
jgi:hypothetical protein